MSEFKKGLYVAAGTLCVVLAVFGILLPVLPTTPFLLLAAFFYSRSSERFYNGLLNNRWFGEYIRNYREGRGIALKQKIVTISILWATMAYGIWFMGSAVWVNLLLVCVALGATMFLISVKTYKPEKDSKLSINDPDPFGEF